MTIRIVHTADNHVDLKYVNYPDAAQQALRQERMDALGRVIEGANFRSADVVVVAGDLFDRSDLRQVGIKTVRQVVDTLAGFAGDRVLVLPGNHDFCVRGQSELWSKFTELAQSTAVVVLDSPDVHECEVNGQRVQFFPCPCPAKTSAQNVIGWVKEAPKDPAAVRVGIAHGNVDGLGLDDKHRYFNMSEAELAGSGVHTWLLGHIHKPAPDEGGSGRRTFFMAGSTTPESVARSGDGSAWCIDVGVGGVERFERFRTGVLSFRRIPVTLSLTAGPGAVAVLDDQLKRADAPRSVVDLRLDGELSVNDLADLRERIERWRGMGFLHFSVTDDVREQLSASRIAERFVDGSRAHQLLEHLLRSEHSGDASVALDLIEEQLAHSGRPAAGGPA